MATIDFDIRCAGCKTNLHGCDPQGVCPHCSRPVADTLAMSLVDPASLCVNGDLSCINCGYNLRTLAARSVCPECATPVMNSVIGRLLHLADVTWLRSVRCGVAMAGWSCVLSILLAAGSAPIGHLSGRGPFFVGSMPTFHLLSVVGHFVIGLLVLLMNVLWCVGLLRAVLPSPSRQRTPREARLAFWVRLTSVLPLACHLSTVIVCVAHALFLPGPVPSHFYEEMVTSSSVGYLIFFIVLRSLGQAAFAASAILAVAYLGRLVNDGSSGRLLAKCFTWSMAVVGLLAIIVWCPLMIRWLIRVTQPQSIASFVSIQIGYSDTLDTCLQVPVIILAAVVFLRYRWLLSVAILHRKRLEYACG